MNDQGPPTVTATATVEGRDRDRDRERETERNRERDRERDILVLYQTLQKECTLRGITSCNSVSHEQVSVMN